MKTLPSIIFAHFLLSVFFTQCFILLHECGHLHFFKGQQLNRILGHVFGLLSGIPFYTWMNMHNLHHKWTGWRDLDPTTEKTIKPSSLAVIRIIVNVAWFLFIPIFYLGYMFSNYWNLHAGLYCSCLLLQCTTCEIYTSRFSFEFNLERTHHLDATFTYRHPSCQWTRG